jgi:hypothetical protein
MPFGRPKAAGRISQASVLLSPGKTPVASVGFAQIHLLASADLLDSSVDFLNPSARDLFIRFRKVIP